MRSDINLGMLDGIARYVENGCAPGGFLTAVLRNDFVEVIACTDHENIERLPAFASYMYNCLPAGIWRSREAMKKWMGLEQEDRDKILGRSPSWQNRPKTPEECVERFGSDDEQNRIDKYAADMEVTMMQDRIAELEADASQLYALKTGLLDRVKCLEARNAELLKERATLNVDVAMAESVTKAAAEQGELYRKHMENYRAKANAQAGEITRLNERVAELTQVMAIANQQTDEITELRAKITELREAYE